jgi:2-polyprenyl-3-methyl-5-hydroxy-6-metoxy-1,4-benzoquinol methylase/ribosomal protein S27E
MALTEHSIRPADTAAEQKRRYEADVARLLAHRGEFVTVPCPACGGADAVPALEKYAVTFQRCRACSTMYLSPRPTPVLLDEYYATSTNYQYWNEVIFPASEATRRERIFKPRVDRLLHLCAAEGVAPLRLLEVGAGFGTFAEELVARGVFAEVQVVEPTPSLAATCRSKGLNVLAQPIEHVAADASLHGHFDVVCSFEVIEHLFEPQAFIAHCKRLLRPGGLLVLTCPNGQGFDILELGAGSPAIDIEHLNYFHPASLSALLTQLGFTVLQTQTPGRLDADIVRNRVLAGEHRLTNAFLQRVLIDEWDTQGEKFQNYLSDAGLSSNMWIVARA